MLYERLLADRRRPDLAGLGRFIKGSYSAALDPASTAVPGRADGFLQTGPVRYEELGAGSGR
jgi:hypothetical protein